MSITFCCIQPLSFAQDVTDYLGKNPYLFTEKQIKTPNATLQNKHLAQIISKTISRYPGGFFIDATSISNHDISNALRNKILSQPTAREPEDEFVTFLCVDSLNRFSIIVFCFVSCDESCYLTNPSIAIRSFLENAKGNNSEFDLYGKCFKSAKRLLSENAIMNGMDCMPCIIDSTCHVVSFYSNISSDHIKEIASVHDIEEDEELVSKGANYFKEVQGSFVHLGWSYSTLINIGNEIAFEITVNMIFLQNVWFMQKTNRTELDNIMRNQCKALGYNKDVTMSDRLERISTNSQISNLHLNHFKTSMKPWLMQSFEFTMDYWCINTSSKEIIEIASASQGAFQRKIEKHTYAQTKVQTSVLYILSCLQILALAENTRNYLSIPPPKSIADFSYFEHIYMLLPMFSATCCIVLIAVAFKRKAERSK